MGPNELVCGEEDLQEAETFKGVIFCGACATRIFAERARRRPRAPASPRVRPPRRTHRPRLRDLHTQTVYYANTIPASVYVPSLDKFAALDTAIETKTKSETADDMAPVAQHLVHEPDRYIQRETGDMPAAPELLTNKKGSTEHKSTAADVALAELGASVELVQVALRRPSVATLVIKSGSGFNIERNKSLSHDFKPGSHSTSASSTCERPLQFGGGGMWRSTRLGSAVKIPFKLLKQNIIDKRFLINVHSRTEQLCPPRGLRDLFHDEISKHHRRGEQVLYTTINRRSKPHELGWVRAATGTKNKRCRHYRAHSYRCLRAHVMRRAGPTRSELHQFLGKIKKLLTGQFVGRLLQEANLTNVRAG